MYNINENIENFAIAKFYTYYFILFEKSFHLFFKDK